jgi:hypothetical protein
MMPPGNCFLLADAGGSRAFVGISLRDFVPTLPKPSTSLLVLSAAGMRAAAVNPEIARAPAVLHLDRLAVDLGRPSADLAPFGAMPNRLLPDVSLVQAASAAVRRGFDRL